MEGCGGRTCKNIQRLDSTERHRAVRTVRAKIEEAYYLAGSLHRYRHSSRNLRSIGGRNRVNITDSVGVGELLRPCYPAGHSRANRQFSALQVVRVFTQ